MKPQILAGLDCMVGHDRYLLEKDASERSITHRLGLYYQYIFPQWDVDCEFNLNLGGPKVISIKPKEFLRAMANTLGNHYGESFTAAQSMVFEDEGVSVEDVQSLIEQLENPTLEIDKEFDVLLHVLKLRDKIGKQVVIKKTVYPDIIIHERETENNFIVIEAKKSSNRLRGARLYDLVKLKCLTEAPFNYSEAYFVDIPVKADYRKHVRFDFAPGPYPKISEVFSR